MEDTALISVLMGVYYRRPDTALLERSVRSILNQSFGDLELLICDDGSSAEAAALLDGAAQRAGPERRVEAVRREVPAGGRLRVA